MHNFKNIDIDESFLLREYPEILDLLLIDNTTKKNIIWATDSYKRKGIKFDDSIDSYIISNNNFIMPRSKKNKLDQTSRSKINAEVFTPSWMCNKQNNMVDKLWIKDGNGFNIENNTDSWTTNENKVLFIDDKTWEDYVKDIRLEISCGEAPYIVSRYDSVSGEKIELNNRIGLLDRKFRIIKENIQNNDDWISYSLIALKSVYGYEWQGDNLLLARENVLLSFIDYFYDYFNKLPDKDLLKQAATIISWNFWQMDGTKCVIPCSCITKRSITYNLFGEEEITEKVCLGCEKGNILKHNGTYSKIMDWEKNKAIKFVDFLKEK